ncbi:iron-sulfur protein [Streptomyces cellostaticus]|uniref:Iron-sulfur protein n=1 Tax=Streptomyces cellostaticus TaxID=67285 RepID=A0A124HDG9_9ACTN|nr:(2Fe-2S)-binding protein [Streptomyces cellostaticus]KUM97506.1 iron-sulfur protein [Streptomyces cellostaticus]GHI04004.1 hypothetical protein Scel_23250 [Streptomyces cellostaticus]
MSLALQTPPTGAVARVLGAAYRRLAETCEPLAVRVDDPDAGMGQLGVTARDMTSDQNVLDAFVAAEARRIQDRYGVAPRRHVAASRALHDYTWSIGLLMSGAWYLERRVPRIRPEDVRLDLDAGAYGIAPGDDVRCLPGDPLAASPGTVTVPHEEALRAELRTAVADHMRPVLDAVGPAVRRGPRALWGMVADDLVSGIWYLGRTLGREEHAVQAATELLPAPVPPYPAGAAFRYLTDAGGGRCPTRTRAGCCLYYTIRPDEACLTCPRTSDAERVRRSGPE